MLASTLKSADATQKTKKLLNQLQKSSRAV
jgi:hypothetical protein